MGTTCSSETSVSLGRVNEHSVCRQKCFNWIGYATSNEKVDNFVLRFPRPVSKLHSVVKSLFRIYIWQYLLYTSMTLKRAIVIHAETSVIYSANELFSGHEEAKFSLTLINSLWVIVRAPLVSKL
jgi:hypothetical protein